MTMTRSDPKHPGPGDALVVVDVQNAFLPGGALAVPEGNASWPGRKQVYRRQDGEGGIRGRCPDLGVGTRGG